MNSVHYGLADVRVVIFCSWDDDCHEIVDIYLDYRYRICLFVVGVLGSSVTASLPETWLSNLWIGSVPISVLQYFVAMSRLVSVVAQKYGGDSTHPICNDVGTTILTGSPGGCGKT